MTTTQIELLRQRVREKNWPLNYDEWPQELNSYTNCLAFALGLNFPDRDHEIFNGSECSIKMELEGFFRILQFNWRQLNSAEEANSDEIVIQAYEWNAYRKKEFHVVRRNLDNTWVHKEGWKYTPQKINNIKNIDYLFLAEKIFTFAVKKSTSS